MKRRTFLATTGTAAVAATQLGASPAQPGLISAENAKPGTSDWQLSRVRLDKNTGVRASAIEGYCSKQSVLAGETLEIMVSVAVPGPYQIEIFRTGYYGGKGARRMQTLGPLPGKKQPDPAVKPRIRP
jgi:hypothetical protein